LRLNPPLDGTGTKDRFKVVNADSLYDGHILICDTFARERNSKVGTHLDDRIQPSHPKCAQTGGQAAQLPDFGRVHPTVAVFVNDHSPRFSDTRNSAPRLSIDKLGVEAKMA
jgi:hypothetical protein